jgi:hypothetical protein
MIEPGEASNLGGDSAVSRKLRGQWRRKRLIFAGILLLFVVVSLELLLNLLCAVSQRVADALAAPWQDRPSWNYPQIDDDILGHRPRPNYFDHDSRGFRNAAAMEAADIVCLGDSQTYGAGVAREDAWPHQLALSSGQSVCSMACGGWGPTHSEALLKEASELRPKLLIEGFYAGNDLWDCFNMVYARKRLTHHLNNDPGVEAAIREANERDPLVTKISRLHRFYIGKFESDSKDTIAVVRSPANTQPGVVRSLLSRHSRVYGLCRALKTRLLRGNEVEESDDEAWMKLRSAAELSRGKWDVFESPQLRTIFVPEYRLAALNQEDPRIKEGHRICLEAIGNMNDELSKGDVDFLVVLIPTKELVFSPQLKTPSVAFRELVTNEEQVWEATRQYLKENDISFVDTLAALRQAVNNGTQPYPMRADGHPNAVGHRVIADAVCQWVRERSRSR